MLKSEEEEERKRKRQPPEPDRGHASRSRLWGWSVFSLLRACTVTQVQQAHMKQAQNCSLYLDLRCLGFWSSTAQCLNLKNTREETKWATSTFSFTLPHDQYAIRNIMTVCVCYLERQHCWQKADVSCSSENPSVWINWELFSSQTTALLLFLICQLWILFSSNHRIKLILICLFSYVSITQGLLKYSKADALHNQLTKPCWCSEHYHIYMKEPPVSVLF